MRNYCSFNDTYFNKNKEAKSIDCCIPGPAGGTIAFADFYALMPPDNAESNASALFITPLAGRTRPVSAHLIITQIE